MKGHSATVVKKMISRWIAVLLALTMFTGCGKAFDSQTEQVTEETGKVEQTQVETAEFSFVDGVPVLDIEGIGKVDHPAWIATYALGYMGAESYYALDVDQSDIYAENCINWLKENAQENEAGLLGWSYSFDSTYNDVSITAPWYSGFGQACGIEALVRWYEKTGDQEALELAQKTAQMLFEPIAEGGLLFSSGDDIWFEEIPSIDQEPSHILNGHMRACIALYLLYDATGDETFLKWYNQGIETLESWLPLYDTGYWLRYDLNPKKEGLLFRFNNPEGGTLMELAIDEIRLTDPLTGESTVIDVGAEDDMDPASGSYLAGLDWQVESTPDGHTVRRLVAAEVESDYGTSSAKPNSYFYLNLPGEWTDNLRTDWFELTISYKDEQEGRVVVEQRSIAPDEEYVAMRDGELLLSGSGEWREWTVPVRPSDLGWPVGTLYAEKHMQYLETLSAFTPELTSWTETACGYLNTAQMKLDAETAMQNAEIVEAEETVLPEQTTVYIPYLSVDADGVALMHYVADDATTTIDFNGIALPDKGTDGCYSPYIISCQAMGNTAAFAFTPGDPGSLANEYPYWGEHDWILMDTATEQATPEAAYTWLRKNAAVVEDSLVWCMNEPNAYNDLVQEAGWQSAFWQRYVLDAFMAIDDTEMVRKAAYAYGYTTEEGGISSVGRDGSLWFEEVPNNSHILNAHLASLVALSNVNNMIDDSRIQELYECGLEALRENLYRYDTGYWTRYDMNPQKNILFELEWNGTESSPQIDSISIYNPNLNTATQLDIGSEKDYEGTCYMSGLRWQMTELADECTVRTIAAPQPDDDANERAAYFRTTLPTYEPTDDFTTPAQQIVIRYKDTAAGEFTVLRQNIADGNVLRMEPLNDAVITCTGDGQWKTAVITLRPQDLGWYMGPDYQAYHNEQLGLIAEQTGDWYFAQTCEKWEYYLQTQTAAQ